MKLELGQKFYIRSLEEEYIVSNITEKKVFLVNYEKREKLEMDKELLIEILGLDLTKEELKEIIEEIK
jgi:hypothetical protein